MDESSLETARPDWSWLYNIGGAAALFSVALIPIQTHGLLHRARA